MPAPVSAEIGLLIVRAIENGDTPDEVRENLGKAQRSANLKPMRRGSTVTENRNQSSFYGIRLSPSYCDEL